MRTFDFPASTLKKGFRVAESSTDVAYAAFRDEWMREVRAGSPPPTALGQRFGRKLVTQWLDVDDSSDDLVYCDGTGDGGVDVAYLDRGSENPEDDAQTGHTWYLVQTKYGSAFAGSETLVAEGRKLVETLDGKRDRVSSITAALLPRLTQFRKSASARDRITLVFGTDDPLSESERRALDDVRALGRARLGALFDVEAISVWTIYQRVLEGGEASAASRLRIPVRARVVPCGEELLVGSISLMDLFAFLSAYRDTTGNLDQLYEKNVRQFLGGRRKVNKAMRETLEQNPERFGLYNNGITIVVSDFVVGGDAIELVEPSIVNGCQTTRTVWEVFHQRLEAGGTGVDPELEAWQKRAGRGVVVAKIVKVGLGGEPLLLSITRYTNSQNAVREKDFVALNSDFRSWAGALSEKYGVFLEIQRGGWDSRRALQRQKPSIRQFTESANAFDLLKVYGAGWLGEAGRAFGRNEAFVPGGTVFKRIMDSDGAEASGFGVEDVYAAYLLERSAQKYGFGRGAEKSTRRQTRFLFFAVVIELLRDVLNRSSQPVDGRSVTRAVLSLFADGNAEAKDELLDYAIQVIDEYLTKDTDDSVFDEPSFNEQFVGDLNGFLKWEQLGKTEDLCPRFRSLLVATKRMMGKGSGGKASARDVIAVAIRDGGASAEPHGADD